MRHEMKKEKPDFQKLMTLSKMNAEVIIKPFEKIIPVYKFFIYTMICVNLLLGSVFFYYIHRSMNTAVTTSKTFTYSINKLTKELANVKRSNAGMD